MTRRPPDPRSPKGLWDEQHQLLSTNLVPWVIKADELIAAFEIIADKDERSLPGESPRLSGVAYMLAGFAIEVLMKAILIQKGKGGIDAKGKFLLRSHDLITLAKDCGLKLTEEDVVLLERLREYLEWAGRYPLAMKSEIMRPRPLSEGGFVPVTAHWAGQDWAAVRELISELKSFLPKVKYAERAKSSSEGGLERA